MPQRTSHAVWMGDLRAGSGTMKIGSRGAEMPFSFDSRFADGSGSNPEELIAAAHAGCFTMATAAGLTKAGFKPDRLTTTASVHLESEAAGFTIKRISLEMEATVPGIDNASFQKIAAEARQGCPVSRALAGVPEITLKATLSS